MTKRLLTKTLMLLAAIAFWAPGIAAQSTPIGYKSITPDLAADKLTRLDKIVLDFSQEGVTFTGCTVNPNTFINFFINQGTPSDPQYYRLSNEAQPLILDDFRIELYVQPEISDVGEYSIWVPKDMFSFTSEQGTMTSKEIYIVFKITEAGITPQPLPAGVESVTPPCGDITLVKYPSGLNSIALNFADAVEINSEMKSGIEMFFASRPYAVETIKVGSDKITVDANNPRVVRLTFTKGMETGYYDISVPAGMFSIKGVPVDAFHLIYKLDNGDLLALSPEEGPVEFLETIYLTYENAAWISYRDYTSFKPTLTYADGTPVEGVSVSITNDNDSRTVMFALNDVLEKVGSYKLNVPAGALTIVYPDETEALNSDLSFSYDIVAVPKPVILPRESSYNETDIENLQEFRLSFNEGLSLKGFEEGPVAAFNLVNELGAANVIANFKIDAARTAIDSRIVYLVAATEEDAAAMAELKSGNYTFTLNPDVLTFAKENEEGEFKNSAYIFNYKYLVSGIGEIEEEATEVTVVSVDGKVLLRNADPSALSTLEKGLYIVNGRKQIVR